MTALEVAQLLIADGLLEVRPNGEIWKSVVRDRGGNRHSIAPRRAETRSKTGYLLVRMNWQGKAYLEHAHRIVFAVRVGPIPQGMTINHRDGSKTHNAPANLEAITQGANNLHAYRTGLKQSAVPRLSETKRAAAKRLRAEGLSYSQIGASLGIGMTTAWNAVNR